MNIQELIGSAPTILLIVASVLVILVVAFILFFLVPGVLHWFRLRRIQRRIAKFSSQNFAAEFKKVFAGDKRLSHLWKEYQDSLHFQHEDRDGQSVVSAVRATVPAELFFNSQFVVDSRLRSEFFKHLPGLFTGIGIIGTFSGLIEGLRQFQVSENAATVRSSLEMLMHLVGEAFLISAAAITAAMLVTLIEKLLLASLYRRAEEISHDIDARFDSGAGKNTFPDWSKRRKILPANPKFSKMLWSRNWASYCESLPTLRSHRRRSNKHFWLTDSRKRHGGTTRRWALLL
ncbi:MotA/TolQ/ExbB proton channel family protein [Pseudomonas frederiksbergensis]|nr:MotA/TolQ/ExbB proton channel family protein [Pseudomonas frederiksbergensis]